jgi:hypothetical protein
MVVSVNEVRPDFVRKVHETFLAIFLLYRFYRGTRVAIQGAQLYFLKIVHVVQYELELFWT